MRDTDNVSLGDLTKIKPSLDEQRSKKNKNSREKKHSVSSLVGQDREASIPIFYISVILLLLLFVIGLAYALYQLNSDFSVLERDHSHKLEAVIEKLNMTDEVISSSGETTQEKLTLLESEVRKLWGVAYDRNKKQIAENESAINKNRKKVDSAVKEYEKQKRQLAEAVKLLKKEMGRNSKMLSTVTELETQVVRIDSVKVEIQEKVSDLEVKLSMLQKELGDYSAMSENRIASNKESIEAVDKFRKQVNRTIMEIKTDIGNIYQQVNPPIK